MLSLDISRLLQYLIDETAQDHHCGVARCLRCPYPNERIQQESKATKDCGVALGNIWWIHNHHQEAKRWRIARKRWFAGWKSRMRHSGRSMVRICSCASGSSGSGQYLYTTEYSVITKLSSLQPIYIILIYIYICIYMYINVFEYYFC